MRSYRLAAVWLLLLAFPAAAETPQAAPLYPTAPLFIETAHSTGIPFTMEVATTPQQQAYGLMFRTSLPENHGMIFIFQEPREANFWMKNTLIPLDMLFVNSQGIVSHIAQGTPQSTELISSEGKVLAVIELMGGTAAKLHIAEGSHVHYAAFP